MTVETVILMLVLASTATPSSDDWTVCYEKATNYETAKCLQEHLMHAESVLEAQLEKAREVLSPEDGSILDKAQSAWEQYRSLQCKLAGLMFEGGRMETLAEIACEIELTHGRAEDVQSLDLPE